MIERQTYAIYNRLTGAIPGSALDDPLVSTIPGPRQETSTSNIFISYRRDDSAAYAGRLCDHLGQHFGAKRIFMDVEDIAPGQNFAQQIDQTMATCGTVLAVIGPKWFEILEQRAKQSQEDYVRHEIEAALERKATVIPILVGGAAATSLNHLPASLAELSLRQAFELRDASFNDDCHRLAKSLGASTAGRWRNPLLAFALMAVLALVLFVVLKKSGIGSKEKQHNPQVAQLLATAETQIKLSEYDAAYRSSKEAVKIDPLDQAALDAEVNTAMLWLENYSVVVPENGNAEDIAKPQLAELMAVLDGGLTRAKANQTRSAGILAHIGWAHWLNRHIAQAEFGPAAEQAFRQALALDPKNVYANAMLGNWLLQNRGSLTEAVQHFNTALASGQQRPLVRTMQLGGMVYNSETGVPAESIRVLNDMRKLNEPAPEGYKNRLFQVNFNPAYSTEFQTSILTAAPPEEVWQTYLWLDDAPLTGSDVDSRQLKRDYFQAALWELAGKKAEALAALQTLQPKLKANNMDGRIQDHVAAALKRLKAQGAPIR